MALPGNTNSGRQKTEITQIESTSPATNPCGGLSFVKTPLNILSPKASLCERAEKVDSQLVQVERDRSLSIEKYI